jgi:hypothetical protein
MLDLAHDHFDSILGTQAPVTARLNWEALGLSSPELDMLELLFSVEKTKRAIEDMPLIKRLDQTASRELSSTLAGTLSRRICTLP